MSKIGVGIPVFHSYQPEVAHDYMRMWFHFGRRVPEHEFYLIPKPRFEQFRARNSIVTTALQFGCDYLLCLDDDMVFDWKEIPNSHAYDFLTKLIGHMEANENMGIVGCLYYQRTGRYGPVLMKHTKEKSKHYQFLNDSEITGGLQKVDVQGGGVMLIRCKIFDKIQPPYFEPEQQTDGNNLGTDLQLCRKAAEAGFEVWCDTSITVGHMRHERAIVTPDNRDSFIADNAMVKGNVEEWVTTNWLKGFHDDVFAYTGLDAQTIIEKAIQYMDGKEDIRKFKDKRDYYAQLGIEQVCRQCYYHTRPRVAEEGFVILKQFRKGFKGYGLDFGCGTAPIGYELLKNGHRIDFVDVEGAEAYKFIKWRVGKSDEKIRKRAGWSVRGPYDFLLFLDSIEHIENWEEVLDNAIGRLKEKGFLVTNFFENRDFDNPEHISMDHAAVAKFLASRGLVPKSNRFWIKDDNFMGGSMTVKGSAA